MEDLQQVAAPKSHERLGVILVMISAAGFGLMGIFAKYAYAVNVNVVTVLSFRFLIAAVIMWSVLLIKRENPRVGGKQLLALAALGILGYAVMASFYFNSVKLIPASITAIILYTYPVIVTLLSAWIYKEAITRYKAISLLISFIGLVLVVGVVFKGLNLKGILYGVGNSLVYSLYIVSSNRLVGRINPLIVSTYVVTTAGLAISLFGWITGSLDFTISTQGWLAILGIATVSSAVAILTFFQGMKLVGPSRASIISTLEPVVTTLAAFLLFAEKLTFIQLIGGGLVVAAVFLVQKDN